MLLNCLPGVFAEVRLRPHQDDWRQLAALAAAVRLRLALMRLFELQNPLFLDILKCESEDD